MIDWTARPPSGLIAERGRNKGAGRSQLLVAELPLEYLVDLLLFIFIGICCQIPCSVVVIVVILSLINITIIEDKRNCFNKPKYLKIICPIIRRLYASSCLVGGCIVPSAHIRRAGIIPYNLGEFLVLH